MEVHKKKSINFSDDTIFDLVLVSLNFEIPWCVKKLLARCHLVPSKKYLFIDNNGEIYEHLSTLMMAKKYFERRLPIIIQNPSVIFDFLKVLY